MTTNEPKCLFCGKPKSSGKRFIGGGGAFAGIEKLVGAEENKNTLGFGATIESRKKKTLSEQLREIAQIAMRKNTGARGLRAIVESVMEDIMFDIPDEKDIRKCIITRAAVLGDEPPVIVRGNESRTA